MIFFKIINKEKNKIFSKIKIIIKKNLEIYNKWEGCYSNKYYFCKKKKIKKNNIIINKKNKILINIFNFIINSNNIIINYKKKLIIKNKKINNLCNCKFSFNFF